MKIDPDNSLDEKRCQCRNYLDRTYLHLRLFKYIYRNTIVHIYYLQNSVVDRLSKKHAKMYILINAEL